MDRSYFCEARRFCRVALGTAKMVADKSTVAPQQPSKLLSPNEPVAVSRSHVCHPAEP